MASNTGLYMLLCCLLLLKNTTSYTINSERRPDNLKVFSVSSGGLRNDGTVEMDITYTTTRPAYVTWALCFGDHGCIQSGGVTIREISEAGTTEYTNEYTHNFTQATPTFVQVSVIGTTDSIFAKLYVPLLTTKDIYRYPAHEKLSNVVLDNAYQAPQNGDLIITINATDRQLANDLKWDSSVFINGLNTSVSPPETFETYDSMGHISISSDDGRVTITLKSSITKFGGIGMFSVPYKSLVTENTLVRQLHYGQMFKVISPYSQDVVEYGQLGLYPLRSITLLKEQGTSILCAAMGNPSPTVSMIRRRVNAPDELMITWTMHKDEYTNAKMVTLDPSYRPERDESFVCRATNGLTTVERHTVIVLPVPITYIDANTRVISNTSDAVVVSCEASGTPIPMLELRRNSKYGPDLEDLYQVDRTRTSSSERLQLTMSPVDTSIHTVYCLAVWEDGMTEPAVREIQISPYPGTMIDGYLFYNTTSIN